MNTRLAVAAVLFVAHGPLRAQDGPPTFVPKDGAMVRVLVEDLPALLAVDSRLARLLAEPDVAEALATFRARVRARNARSDALLAAAAALGIDTHEHVENRFLHHVDVPACQRFETVVLPPPEGSRMPRTVVLLGCTPKAEGRLTQAFEALANAMAGKKALAAVADAKIGGFPIHRFGWKRDPQDPDEQSIAFRPHDQWLAHLPGTFVIGQGTPDDCGAVAAAPVRAAAHAALTVDVEAYLAMIVGVAGMAPFPFAGLDGVDRLDWRGRFEGDRLLDEIELTLGDPAKGMLAGLVAGTAKLPAQPLPEGALVQVRCAIDLALLLDAANGLTNVRAEVRKEVLAAFTGGAALAAVAPAPGAMLPRLYLSLGIADDAALTRALDLLLANRADASKRVAYDGVECTVLAVPGAPSGLQPVFCRVDGVLHVAESGTSMRALLKALKNGGDAMDVGDAPLPAGPGEPLGTFDLRCDEAAMYRTFHDVWLPLFALVPADELGMQPLLRRDDMPEPDVVGKHVGKSRGVLRRDGNKFTIQHLGTLGGPAAAALAMTWGPIVSGWMHSDWQSEHLVVEIGRRKIEIVWQALDAIDRDQAPWPATLGELLVAAKLPDDALLVPGDELAEDVVMPAGDTRRVKSSFRYFPAPLQLDVQGEANRVLFLAIAPRRYGRIALADDGRTLELWGEDSQRAIDGFK